MVTNSTSSSVDIVGRAFQRSVLRTMVLVAWAKMIVPAVFMLFFGWLSKGYNAPYFPWHELNGKLEREKMKKCGWTGRR